MSDSRSFGQLRVNLHLCEASGSLHCETEGETYPSQHDSFPNGAVPSMEADVQRMLSGCLQSHDVPLNVRTCRWWVMFWRSCCEDSTTRLWKPNISRQSEPEVWCFRGERATNPKCCRLVETMSNRAADKMYILYWLVALLMFLLLVVGIVWYCLTKYDECDYLPLCTRTVDDPNAHVKYLSTHTRMVVAMIIVRIILMPMWLVMTVTGDARSAPVQLQL